VDVVSPALVRWWLEHHRASALGAAGVLRGSVVTASWVPGRVADDLDFVLRGAWSVAAVTGVLESLARGVADARVTTEGIWLETPWPGVRVRVERGDERLQIDYGWGDPLTVPPRPFALEGVDLVAVAPEQMFGWKTHSLVERGPRGRWHPKTLADLVLIARHTSLDDDAARRCVREAFESHAMRVTDLDGFFDDPTWGLGRSSSRKWKKYTAASPWVTFRLDEALREARSVVARVLRRSP
jgi:hypothetical protein